jgi:hypothetical protein
MLSTQPIYIFREILQYMGQQRIVIPAYALLATTGLSRESMKYYASLVFEILKSFNGKTGPPMPAHVMSDYSWAGYFFKADVRPTRRRAIQYS